jgi:hypothetical protein
MPATATIFRKVDRISSCKVGTWQHRLRRVVLSAVFALPFAAVLLAGAHQVGESKALGVSPEEGNDGGSAGTVQADSLLLVNRTDTAFVALAFHPKTARPLKSKIEVNLSEKRASEEPSFYVAAGDSTALWPCDSLGQYENYELHLYRIPGGRRGS